METCAVGGKNIPECRVSEQEEYPEHLRASTEPSMATVPGAGGSEREARRPGARPSMAPRHEQELGIYYNEMGHHWTIWGGMIRLTFGGVTGSSASRPRVREWTQGD